MTTPKPPAAWGDMEEASEPERRPEGGEVERPWRDRAGLVQVYSSSRPRPELGDPTHQEWHGDFPLECGSSGPPPGKRAWYALGMWSSTGFTTALARLAKFTLIAVALIYVGLCVVVFVVQRRLLYFPARATEAEELTRAARAGFTPWRDGAGKLIGWRASPAKGARTRVLVFHGNAGSALDREHLAAALVAHGLEVVLLEYPGFGARPGTPSIDSLSAAAVDALQTLGAEGRGPVWLLGESVGSGVAARAIALLPPHAVQALLLVTPFSRITEVARIHYPLLPSVILRDRYAPIDDLAAFRGPTVVLVAGRDEVVGAEQGRRLFASLQGPKQLVVQELATHNSVELWPSSPFWEGAVTFLESHE
jgi:pimeloyl-ACP methyl ester carboxylesterase